MNKKLSKYLYLLFLFTTIISGCSSTNVKFTEAVDAFEMKNYLLSKELFTKYHFQDSSFWNYESYAFLAETYKQLGLQDSGAVLYEQVLGKIKEIINKDSKKHKAKVLALEDLNKWYKKYPEFPECLKRKNGFVPTDSLPFPIGGIEAISKRITYPISARIQGLEGRVFIGCYVDENGRPSEFEVYKTISEECSNAAIEGIKKVSFTIPRRKGRIAKTWIVVPVKFQLE